MPACTDQLLVHTSEAILGTRRSVTSLVAQLKVLCIHTHALVAHLPSKPELEGIRTPAALNCFVPKIILSMQFVWLKKIARSTGICLFEQPSMLRQKHTAL
jgi:hypothetical protein